MKILKVLSLKELNDNLKKGKEEECQRILQKGLPLYIAKGALQGFSIGALSPTITIAIDYLWFDPIWHGWNKFLIILLFCSVGCSLVMALTSLVEYQIKRKKYEKK